MSLLLEIECEGPRPLACLTHCLLVAQVLREQGALAEDLAWDLVRPVPRHPDWGSNCRLVLAHGGNLIPGTSAPGLVRLLEAAYAERFPDYHIRLHPVFDPTLVFPNLERPARQRPALPPGALHQLLNPQES